MTTYGFWRLALAHIKIVSIILEVFFTYCFQKIISNTLPFIKIFFNHIDLDYVIYLSVVVVCNNYCSTQFLEYHLDIGNRLYQSQSNALRLILILTGWNICKFRLVYLFGNVFWHFNVQFEFYYIWHWDVIVIPVILSFAIELSDWWAAN